MGTYKDYRLVQKCLLQIEEKLDWGKSEHWHSDVFIELSQSIQQQTNVLLSTTTLKRVWGKVNYQNAPSISTLNTLSQFAGYVNWRDFKNKIDLKPKHNSKSSSIQGKVFVYAALIAILFISLYSTLGSKDTVKNDFDFSKIEFKSRSITSGIPNSVVFDFDLKGLKSDSIYIQQFWDPNKTIKLKQEQVQATGQYYYPGYFRAKLLVDGKIIIEHDLFIESQGWLGIIDYSPIPKYIDSKNLGENKLAFSNDVIEEVKSNDEPIFSSFHFVKDLNNISGDNFQLNTAIKNSYREKWAICQMSTIIIVGSKSAFFVPFSIPGCVSEINAMFSEVRLNGKETDLSSFGIDLTTFRNINIKVKNKHVRVFVDDKNIFSQVYNESIGELVGVRYRFLGVGEVNYLNIISNSESIELVQNSLKDLK
jgi:hypothetical protein